MTPSTREFSPSLSRNPERVAAGDDDLLLSLVAAPARALLLWVSVGADGTPFLFALPVRPARAEGLAGVTLSGPGGSVRLDGETGRPVTILRDPGTGEIRGILRGVAGGLWSGNEAALAVEPGLEVLTSRGIPAGEDWGW